MYELNEQLASQAAPKAFALGANILDSQVDRLQH
jgi:hypothetical protein